LGDGGWSEEKRRYAVNSKGKLSNNSFLVVFSLRVDWLDHSAKIYSYQPMIWRMLLVKKVGGVYCLGKGEYFFSVNNQIYGRGGQVRGEEPLCCQFKALID
jgi:hypothetical protein